MSGASAGLPVPESPIADTTTGFVTHTWRYFFQRMLARTGGTTGGIFGPPVPVVPTLSPFRFAASASSGTMLISGGGVTGVRINPGGPAWFATGSFYGAFPLTVNSQIEVTYVRAPTMTFIPG